MKLDGWPREKIAKDELQWEVGDKVDVYLESVKNFMNSIGKKLERRDNFIKQSKAFCSQNGT